MSTFKWKSIGEQWKRCDWQIWQALSISIFRRHSTQSLDEFSDCKGLNICVHQWVGVYMNRKWYIWLFPYLRNHCIHNNVYNVDCDMYAGCMLLSRCTNLQPLCCLSNFFVPSNIVSWGKMSVIILQTRLAHVRAWPTDHTTMKWWMLLEVIVLSSSWQLTDFRPEKRLISNVLTAILQF